MQHVGDVSRPIGDNLSMKITKLFFFASNRTTSGFTDCCNAERVTGRKLKKCNYNENENVVIQNCGMTYYAIIIQYLYNNYTIITQ